MALSACQAGAEAPIERGRLVSPNGEFDAVLAEWPTNATVGFVFGVAFVIHGQVLPAKMDSTVVSSSLSVNGLRWVDDKTFEVQYPTGAQIYSFQNRWYPPDALKGVTNRHIEIILNRR
jgi:hypothetical protein